MPIIGSCKKGVRHHGLGAADTLPRELSPLQRPKKRGKGGKKGKAEKRERRKKRERKGKAKKASARFLSKYGARPGGGCALRCLHAGLWNKEF